MIWGHDDSAQLLVNLIILIAILSVHFVKLYLKQKKRQDEDESNKNQE